MSIFVESDRIVIKSPKSAARLAPTIRMADRWLSPSRVRLERDTLCAVFDHAGELSVQVEGDTLRSSFVASHDCVLQGIGFDGELRLPEVAGLLSHGFQSWSQCGVLSLGEPPTDEELDKALLLRGDEEVLRTGAELSWWFSYAGCDDEALFAGALSANAFKSWVQLSRTAADVLRLRMMSGGAGEEIALAPGQSQSGELWRVELGGDLPGMLERYGKALPSRRRVPGLRPQAGWNSWYELWRDGVTAAEVEHNAALARDALLPLTQAQPLRVVVDDGWQKAWGDWEPNDKFPSGLEGLSRDLRGRGFEMGVWLAPLLADEGSEVVRQHPEWFVADVGYCVLGTVQTRVLDVTHPGAAAHLASVIRRIVGWGYSFLKIDFLFAGAYEAKRHRAATGMQALHRALQIIREAAGNDTFLLAISAPPVGCFEYVDAYRIGFDIALHDLGDVRMGPSWPFIVNQLRSLAARSHLGHAVLCDADPPLLRDLPRAEVEAGAWVVALSGGALFLSDRLQKVDPERFAWALDQTRMTCALSGLSARPLDLFPERCPQQLSNAVFEHLNRSDTQVAPSRWQLPDGRHLLFNTHDVASTIEATLLPARSAHLVAP